MSTLETSYADVIVVGGGSCGSVVASRASANPDCRVVLLESGPGLSSDGTYPPEILNAHVLPVGPSSPWTSSYRAELTPEITRWISRGRVLGGSGAVNGGYFVRGRPQDFDAWPASWSYDEVLPYFLKSETDLDFSGEWHGRGGPMPVARTPRGAQNEITKLFHDAAMALGYPGDPDMNDPSSFGGMGAVPLNVVDGRRVNAAAAYLLPVLDRSNLDVLTESTVVAVLFDRTRATGVEVIRKGHVSRFMAPSVVLCAGSVRTPQLLMLSGVGPADHLVEKGVPVVLDHPYVGRDFSDHPEVGVCYRTPIQSELASPLQEVLHVDDLEIRPYTAAFDRLIPGLPIGDPMIGVGLMRSDSRGDIRLVSTDPTVSPLVKYRYLESVGDRRAVQAGLDRVAELLGRLSRSCPIEILDDLGDPLSSRLGTSLHLSGSCAMGNDNSVLDDRLQVRGLEGLMVADTSAFPVVPTRGPHATAVMLAERAAAMLSASAT
ncbi:MULTISPECIES: mycofactocin system GMC family oxidoreductase MftG [unclassified Rhodococcus (in: high G+C Gram-positive bacteria)]|uniref:mycofactocin dehydrogenase MftG n=1 Tax=unclassified Rhodococcus (in: high G+C Gram-positive bacteria) TaxID=192944 RepID=UPI001FF7C8BF|nr:MULTISPECIES: mycofactocin system GMC family oxidoreductase MftG [unclassified Rhodococcus (in: high G+C Gram-positive bacteria)]